MWKGVKNMKNIITPIISRYSCKCVTPLFFTFAIVYIFTFAILRFCRKCFRIHVLWRGLWCNTFTLSGFVTVFRFVTVFTVRFLQQLTCLCLPFQKGRCSALLDRTVFIGPSLCSVRAHWERNAGLANWFMSLPALPTQNTIQLSLL